MFSIATRGEHGQDQHWISCRIIAIFLKEDWTWILIRKLDQDRIKIFVCFL